jgi:hypothetical protein
MCWDDIEAILFEGTREMLDAARCPDCGGAIEFEFNETHHTLRIRCIDCNTWTKGCKASTVPNCVAIYGTKRVLGTEGGAS